MIDDYLFESVAVSIGEENRNGDETPLKSPNGKAFSEHRKRKRKK